MRLEETILVSQNGWSMLLPVQFVTSNTQGKLYRRSGKGTMVTGMKSGMGLLDLAVTSMIHMVLEWTSARSKT